MASHRQALLAYALAILVIELFFISAYTLFPDTALVDLAGDHNLASWFSALQLAAIAVASLFAFESERYEPSARLSFRWLWTVCALGFFCLSSAEALALHERVLTDAVRHVLPVDWPLQAILPWQLVFAPAIFVAFVVMNIMVYTRLTAQGGLRLLALTGLTLWILSFVFEGTGKPFFIPAHRYRLAIVIEESVEMLGGTCLLFAIAAYAAARFQGVAAPIRRVRWGWTIGVAAGLVGTAAAVIAVVTLANPAYLHGRAGDKLVKERDYSQALIAYEHALALRPDDAGLRQRLARANLYAHRYDEAVRAYREAIALAPTNPTLHHDLGIALHQSGDVEAAVAAYEAALRINPGYARAHKHLAVSFEKLGNLTQAEAHYRLAVAYDPSMADAHRYLGNLLKRQGRLDEARQQWRKSLAADPTQEKAATLHRLLREAEDASKTPRGTWPAAP